MQSTVSAHREKTEVCKDRKLEACASLVLHFAADEPRYIQSGSITIIRSHLADSEVTQKSLCVCYLQGVKLCVQKCFSCLCSHWSGAFPAHFQRYANVFLSPAHIQWPSHCRKHLVGCLTFVFRHQIFARIKFRGNSSSLLDPANPRLSHSFHNIIPSHAPSLSLLNSWEKPDVDSAYRWKGKTWPKTVLYSCTAW